MENRTRARVEIAAVLATGGAFLVFENVLHLKLWFLVPCILLWSAYLLGRGFRDRREFRDWGFRADNLGPAARAGFAFLLAAGAAMLCWRLVRGWRPLPATSLAVFALYPVWGLLQQFFLQALVTRNLRILGLPPVAIVPVSAALFGAVHLPDAPLAALCAGAGVAWTVLYLRIPNLWPLAFAHAWLGTLVYYWVLERNPWLELFPNG